MMQRIDLAPLLRETLTTPYSDMVTRTTGAALRIRIEGAISNASHRTTQLDFTSVGLLDFSCADEVVAKLLLRAAEEEEHYVVLSGVTESHLDAIDHVLERHGLSVGALTQGEVSPRVLGTSTPDVQAAFQTVQRLGAGNAERLADALGWTVERAADALQCLALRRLIQAAGGTYRPLAMA
jgi:hypothetical protein